MARKAKKIATREQQSQGSSNGSASDSRDPTQRSAAQSIPRLDGNRDPNLKAIDYTKPTDLKNISEFLGLAGWYAARGVSTMISSYYPRSRLVTPPLSVPSSNAFIAT